jgi:hypothetical protein
MQNLFLLLPCYNRAHGVGNVEDPQEDFDNDGGKTHHCINVD